KRREYARQYNKSWRKNPRNRKKYKGLQVKRREYNRKYMNAWRRDPKNLRKTKKRLAERRKNISARIALLKTVPCMDCKRTFDPVCMDFDHRPGSCKKMAIAEMLSRNLGFASIMAEIRKCDVVCACCHRLRTKKRRKKHRNS